MRKLLILALICAPGAARADSLFVGGSGPGANYEPGVFIQGQEGRRRSPMFRSTAST